MKLINKINLINLLLSVIIITIGSFAVYFIYKNNLDKTRDEGLKFMLSDQLSRLSERPESPSENRPPPGRNRGSIVILESPQEKYEIFSDTLIFHPPSNTLQPHRKLSSVTEYNGKFYKADLFLVAIEGDTVLKTVIYSMGIIFIILIVFIIGGNYFLSQKIFRPFYQSLEKIKNFNFNSNNNLKFEKSGIKEFNELNLQLQRLTDYVSDEYNNIKEFSENASHEIKTPISVIKAKLDSLIQFENLNEEQFKLIKGCFVSLDKLKRINDGLTLLTKIENNEFIKTEEINIKQEIEESYFLFSELLSLNKIKLEITGDKLIWQMNKELSEILISNLLKNAIKNNYENGYIKVEIKNNYLKFSNTSNSPSLDREKIFNRFYKSSSNSDSVGLGLSIVKKICDLYSLKIEYSFENNIHHFKILNNN